MGLRSLFKSGKKKKPKVQQYAQIIRSGCITPVGNVVNLVSVAIEKTHGAIESTSLSSREFSVDELSRNFVAKNKHKSQCIVKTL